MYTRCGFVGNRRGKVAFRYKVLDVVGQERSSQRCIAVFRDVAGERVWRLATQRRRFGPLPFPFRP
jgi:hypothetical protein